MRRALVALVALAGALAISGCAGRTVLMKNHEGQIAKCEVSAGSTMLTGVIIRDMTIKQCVQEYQRAGFSRISPE